MGCLTTQQRTDYTADLARVVAYITLLNTAILSGLDSAATQRYDFDAGTGRQSEVFRSPMELMDRLNALESRRDLLRRLLGCRAIMHQQVRR